MQPAADLGSAELNGSARTSRRPRSIVTGIYIAAAIIAFVVLILLGISWWSIRALATSVDRAIYQVEREAQPLLALSGEVQSTLYLFASSLEDSDTAPLEQALASIDAQVTQLEGLDAPRLAEEQVVIEDAIETWRAVEAAMPGVQAVVNGPLDPAARDFYLQFNEAAAKFREAHTIALEDALRETAGAKRLRDGSLIGLAVATLVFGATGILTLRRETHVLRRRIEPLHEGALRVARGDFSEPIPLEGAAEFVDLAMAFNSMAQGIRDREARLSYRALHDPLTDLGNRSMLDDRLHGALARLRRDTSQPLALMFVDLDGFKKVNDTLGHAAGDETIRMAAQRIERCLRDGDTLVRLGGDEFAVLAESVGAGAEALGERIREVLDQPYFIGDSRMSLSGSVGVALATTGRESVEDLLRSADLAMYDAKRDGGNLVRVFRDAFREQAMHRAQVEEELRSALEEGQLEVYYQPVFDLADRRVRGVEALVRWHHPQRGLVLPEEFIPIAEESGLALPLGAQVLRQATSDFMRWSTQHRVPDDFHVSVNVSSRQLSAGGFAQGVLDRLAAVRMPPSRLVIEITETTLLVHAPRAREELEALRAAGVTVALDDFGTGYTTLQYLQQLPVDVLKIDHAFVTGLARRDDLRALVKTIVDLAVGYHLGVVAEGVEEDSDVAALMQLGCDMGQGFGLGRPMPAAEIEPIFEQMDKLNAA